MMSEEELHSMRVIGEMLGTTASFLPLSICILYVVCSSHPSALTLSNLYTDCWLQAKYEPASFVDISKLSCMLPLSRNTFVIVVLESCYRFSTCWLVGSFHLNMVFSQLSLDRLRRALLLRYFAATND